MLSGKITESFLWWCLPSETSSPEYWFWILVFHEVLKSWFCNQAWGLVIGRGNPFHGCIYCKGLLCVIAVSAAILYYMWLLLFCCFDSCPEPCNWDGWPYQFNKQTNKHSCSHLPLTSLLTGLVLPGKEVFSGEFFGEGCKVVGVYLASSKLGIKVKLGKKFSSFFNNKGGNY